MTDRGFRVAGLIFPVNVRRLMYQSLILALVLGDDARRLGASLNSKDGKGLANALVDRVWGDLELARNLLGAEVLVDKEEAVELTCA
jgi:hypothetical protein